MKAPTDRAVLILFLGIVLSGFLAAQTEEKVHVEGVPEIGEAIEHLKNGERQQGEAVFDRGVARLQKSLKDEPAKAAIWHYRLGQLYYHAHRDEHAIAALEAAEQSGGRNADVYSLLTRLCREAGDQDQVAGWYAKWLKIEPEDEDLHWNLAQTWQLAGKAKESRTAFIAIAKRIPHEWKAYTKIIQLSEQLGDKKTRDDWHARLYALRKTGEIKTLNQVDLFVRDQFVVGATKVYAMEYFEMLGERKVKYSFNLRDTRKGEDIGKISLGSYDTTNAIGRSTEEGKKRERLYHLDGYYPDGSHSTFGFFDGNPGYDTVKPMVVDIVDEKREPISRMVPSEEGATIELNE